MAITKQDYIDLFATEGGRAEIVRSLRGLPRSKGWQILMLYFQELLEVEEEKLHDIDGAVEMEDLQKIRIKLYYIKQMMGMPSTLAKEILESKEMPIVEDVYN